jgi:hypothetical protein
MDIDKLCRNALLFLKTYPNFPKRGFIAGGSLGNLIWEQVSGNIAKINDIDVFLLENIVERNTNDCSNWLQPKDPNPQKLFYHKKETVYYEDYTGLCSTSQSKDFYYIESTSHDGIYNFVNYSANKRTPQLIIDSFDINCTQVGYSIEEDKFYYTPEFVDFLYTGDLKLTNLMSPAHSAIRLIKKKYDLGAKLNELELKLCQYSIESNMVDITRRYFTEKYASVFRKYETELSPYFNMIKDDSIKELFKTKGLDLEIFTLEMKKEEEYKNVLFLLNEMNNSRKIFDEPNINKIHTGQSLLFYIRNVQGDSVAKNVWSKLNYLYNSESYVDSDDISNEDIEMLQRLTQVAPKTIENLKDLKLSQQISIMKNLFDKYKEDPIVAISILEKMKIDPDKEFDEGDILLLELSVRKEIVNDVNQKALRITKPELYENSNKLNF